MPIKTLSTRRSQAASAVSSSAVSFNNPDGTGFAISGTGVTSNTTIKTQPVTVGTTSANSTVTVSAPVITSYTVTDASYNNLDDVAVDTAGGYIKINGTNFSNTNLAVYFNGSLVSNTYVSPIEVRAVIPATAVGSYNLMMFNGSLGAIYSSVATSGFPTWTVSSYVNNSLTVNVQLMATGDGTLTYSLYSGTLPTGLTLSANGLISGTATSDSVTSDLVILVNDSQNQTTQQTITLTIQSVDTYWKNTVLLLNADTANTVFDDASSNLFIPTVVGDTRPAARSPFASSTLVDGSLYFDGSGDYLTYADNAAFKFGSGDWTVECWVYATSLPAEAVVISKYNAGGTAGTNQWILSLNTGVPTISVSTTGTAVTQSATGSTLSTNTWYHLAAVRNGSNLTMYVNGVGGTANTGLGSSSLYGSETEVLGVSYRRNNGSTAFPLTGFLSNIRITKGQALYTANFTPSTSALTTTSQSANSANVMLLTAQTNIFYNNTKIIDSGNNDITITTNGSVTQGTFTPAGPNWSAYFDGSGYLGIATSTAFEFGTGDFTVEFWFYTLADSGQNGNTNRTASLITNYGLPSAVRGWSVNLVGDASTTGTAIQFANAINSTTEYYITYTATIAKGQWYHFAAVRSGTTTSLYLNGTSVASGTLTNQSITSSNQLRIGALDYSVSFYNRFIGFISNLRIVKGQAVYTANFTPSTTPLTTTSQSVTAANVSILTCQSYQFKDNSTNLFSLTKSGNAAVTKFSPFNMDTPYSPLDNNASYGFNGTTDYLSIASSALMVWGAGDFTFETWIYLNANAIPANATVWDQRNGTNGVAVVQPDVELSSASGYSFYTRAVTRFISGSAAVKLRQWQHLAIVRSSGVTRMYLDGVQTGSTYTDSDNYPAGSINIGRANDGVSTRFFPGYFYNMRLVVGTAVYTANNTPSTSPLTAIANTKLLLKGTSGGLVDATGQNNVYTHGNSVITTVQEKFGAKSIFFDGTGDYLTVLNAANTFNFGTSDFTVEAWVYPTTVSKAMTILDTRTAGASTTGLIPLDLDATGNPKVYIGNGNLFTSSTALVANTWTHLAVVRYGSTVTLYINGTKPTTGNGTSSAAVTDNFCTIGTSVGNRDGTATGHFQGYIDDLRITRGYARYVGNFTVPNSPFFTS